jgi:hypothetical protein
MPKQKKDDSKKKVGDEPVRRSRRNLARQLREEQQQLRQIIEQQEQVQQELDDFRRQDVARLQPTRRPFHLRVHLHIPRPPDRMHRRLLVTNAFGRRQQKMKMEFARHLQFLRQNAVTLEEESQLHQGMIQQWRMMENAIQPDGLTSGEPQQQQPEQVQSTMDQLQVAASGVEQQEDEQQDRKLSPNEFGRHKKDSEDK